MIAAAQARQSLEQLGLAEAAAVLDGRLEAASQKQLPYADFLADLLSTETAVRRERYLRTRTRLAHLPFQRTLDQFDFRFQPSIDKRQVRDLATLTFISEAANVLFLGPPGVGKTHLAIALGLRAIEQGSGVYFVRRTNCSRISGAPRPSTASNADCDLPGAQAAHHRRVRRVAL